jgi:hypothetical protein
MIMGTMSSFLLTYEFRGIYWNICVIARDWAEARSKAPQGAKNVNAAWVP